MNIVRESVINFVIFVSSLANGAMYTVKPGQGSGGHVMVAEPRTDECCRALGNTVRDVILCVCESASELGAAPSGQTEIIFLRIRVR